VRGHDGPGARRDRGLERHQLPAAQQIRRHVQHRQAHVRVDRHVAVAREVLDARRDARLLVRRRPGPDVPGGQLRVRGEAAHADHRVGRVGVDVGDRGQVERHAGRGEPPRHGPRDVGRQRHVVEPTEHRVARVGRAGGGVQPGDVAALLVDGDDGGRVGGTDLPGQRRQLLFCVDICTEEADAGQSVAQPSVQPGRQLMAQEAGQQHARRLG
jgi:hypothetical protein